MKCLNHDSKDDFNSRFLNGGFKILSYLWNSRLRSFQQCMHAWNFSSFWNFVFHQKRRILVRTCRKKSTCTNVVKKNLDLGVSCILRPIVASA